MREWSASAAAITPSRILVVGAGAREHALAWRLAQEPGVERVIATPGNPGIAQVAAIRADVSLEDQPAAIVRMAQSERVDLVVVGPEGPLISGLVDRLDSAGVPAFGPAAAAARIEGSKAFCREVATAAGVPMAEGRAFESAAEAIDHGRALGGQVAVKADGLASGKGVWLCSTDDEIESAVGRALALPVFNDQLRQVVVERALTGREASVIAICDGRTALALPAARDHKRIGDGDTGPNTGGMGAYSPLPDFSDADVASIVERFHVPVLRELQERGSPFRGALYAGLMLTDEGPRLLEFNARFGDPETQAILPRVAAPLAPLLLAAARDRLADVAEAMGIDGRLVPATRDSAVALVLAAPGYPERPETGSPVEGIGRAESAGALVFYAGVRISQGRLVTSGGRVLTVVGTGATLDDAAARAYAATDEIDFRGKQLRRDIGRELAPAAVAA
jgi:phosphoribosylamine---glycine ligase